MTYTDRLHAVIAEAMGFEPDTQASEVNDVERAVSNIGAITLTTEEANLCALLAGLVKVVGIDLGRDVAALAERLEAAADYKHNAEQ